MDNTTQFEFEVRVEQTKYDDTPCFSIFKVMAKDYFEAEKKAKQEFSEMTGFGVKDCKAFVFDKYKHSK